LTYAGPPFQMSATPARDGRAPLLGEHSADLLAELGLGEGEIAELRTDGVV
jgi:crotonobetainyl-CoA:carnitine CoA-transferase CaiB-like acyl-CoA transferase